MELAELRKELALLANADKKRSMQHYFKEGVDAYGIPLPQLRKTGKIFASSVKRNTKAEVFTLCEALFASGKFEEAIVATQCLEALRKKMQPEDFVRLEKWITRYATNWAVCDTLCHHTVGDFLTSYPVWVPKLRTWATSESRWMRRAAAVSLILPCRKGHHLDMALEIASLLLKDTDDLVQKGCGWLLKECAKTHENEVAAFIRRHKKNMPRTALRYAIEKMPEHLRKELMRK